MTTTHYVIPSYQRAEIVRDKSLPQLNRLGVGNKETTVFVASEEEERTYKGALPDDVTIVVGELGIGRQRKFINKYFPEGDRIVSVDDDVELVQKNDNKVKPLELPLPELARRAFSLCEETGTRFWGTVTSSNGFFQRHQVVHGLRDCTGGLFGEYAQETDCHSSLDSCEDSEKILLHYVKYGGILRLDDVCGKNSYYSDGGVNAYYEGKENRLKDYLRNLGLLVDKFPDLVSIKTQNLDKPEKGLTKIKLKTVTRLPSILNQ